jgi:DNA polymerase III epsilon subunit-like protein
MSKKVCILYTSTNGLHIANGKVTKKNMYGIARLISLTYSIGCFDNNKYIEEKRVDRILKPACICFNKEAQKFHNISYEKAEKKGILNRTVIEDFRKDLKDVRVIISHSLEFHLKSIQAECFRSCIGIDFSKYILIDTISFQHDYSFPKLVDLESNLKLKKSNNNIDKIANIFGKLYQDYKKELLN